MSDTRYELPWDVIIAEVLRATNDYHDKRFCNVKHIANYIQDHIEAYPLFAGCTYKTIQTRVSTSFRKLNWTRFTEVGSRASVYINPDIPE